MVKPHLETLFLKKWIFIFRFGADFAKKHFWKFCSLKQIFGNCNESNELQKNYSSLLFIKLRRWSLLFEKKCLFTIWKKKEKNNHEFSDFSSTKAAMGMKSTLKERYRYDFSVKHHPLLTCTYIVQNRRLSCKIERYHAETTRFQGRWAMIPLQKPLLISAERHLWPKPTTWLERAHLPSLYNIIPNT